MKNSLGLLTNRHAATISRTWRFRATRVVLARRRTSSHSDEDESSAHLYLHVGPGGLDYGSFLVVDCYARRGSQHGAANLRYEAAAVGSVGTNPKLQNFQRKRINKDAHIIDPDERLPVHGIK
eukprot:scaffold7349_cov173-Amphora_coffeaeformis.AAC.46